MKKIALFVLFLFAAASIAQAQLTFYLIDNFEDGTYSKWYVFDGIAANVVPNPALKDADSVGESCGEKSLKIVGATKNWYVGGMGTVLDVDGAEYSRFLMDVYGGKNAGKIKVEMFERKSAATTEEVKWVAELPVLGPGFTRYSVPLSAFNLDGSSGLAFHGKKGGNISKIQIICVASSEEGAIDLAIDNLIFTF